MLSPTFVFARHPADDITPGSPQWYLEKLLGELGKRKRRRRLPAVTGVAMQERPSMALLEAYYLGEYELPWVSRLAGAKYSIAFRDMLASVQDNWLALITDATAERLHPEGFLFGGDQADTESWDLWQRSNMDAESDLLHTTALNLGTAYTMVGWDESGEPVVTVESPTSVVCGYQDTSTSEPMIALKTWIDDWIGDELAALYSAREIWTFRRSRGDGWQATDLVANRLGAVPFVEYSCNPYLGHRSAFSRGGRSDLKDFLSTQDQINKLVCDLLVGAEFGAFRGRWATGVELPPGKTDEDAWEVALSSMVRSGNAAAKFGTFESSDLGQYVKAIENRIQSVASRSRTPPHYMLGSSMGQFPSGESLRAAEAGLTSKAKHRQTHFEDGHERTIRLMWQVKGDTTRASYARAHTLWRDAEQRSESEHIDALGKMRALLDVPPQVLWQRAGFTPTEIENFERLLAEWAIVRETSLADEPADDPEPEPVGAGAGADT